MLRSIALWMMLSLAALASATAQQSGGTIRGVVKSGAVPLPGVSITATNTLTGRKYSGATGIDGTYKLTIPQNGRYVVRAELAAFAPTTKEALLNAASHEQTADFGLVLASRAAKAADATARGPRQYSGAGAQSLGLLGSAADLIAAGAAAASSGAQLPSLAANQDFSGESIAVNGQSGTTSPFAGLDMGQLRQNMQANQLDQSLSQSPGGSGGSGRGGFGGGGFGGGPRNFRHFNPNQPHGAFFWNGGNSALDAKDFAIRGQQIEQPGYATNRFGLTFLGAPYIPKLLTHDRKDFIFLTLSGQRSSSPFDQYGTVPTAAQRAGDFSTLATQSGTPITLYDPKTGLPFPGNVIPGGRISPQAQALLNYVPLPNLPGDYEDYQRLTTAQSNTTVIGARYVRSFGAGSGGSPIVSLIRQYLGQGGNGLRQNINANFNYSHAASDQLNILPELGGKEQTHQYSLELGYTLGKGKLTNNLTGGWNRTNTELRNYFTNVNDVAGQLGLNIFNGAAVNPINYGLPNVTLNQFTGLSEQQPNFQTNQTISISDSLSWIHGKHNFKFGGDARRVHLDLLGQTNSTGTYYFTGFFTEKPGSSSVNGVGNTGNNGLPDSGSSLADLLLGLPQQTALQAPYQKSYLRQNTWDAYAQDSWRALPNLTLLAGLRWEYFSPYAEKDDRLATLDTGNNFASVATVLSNGIGPYSGKYPRTLIYPERGNVSPRMGFAWSGHHDIVIRGGYGINFANGQYVKFVQNFAFQPPFADVQTNEATQGAAITLANGFPAPQTIGNYAVNKNYKLPYVQVWNLNIQKTFPLGILLNIGYSGSKGTRLDIVDAPGRTATESLSGFFYDYEDSVAFSNYNALSVRLRKRMQSGVALGATYTYAHSIDNASSIGGNGGTGVVVAQNWQNLLAEESNSSFDIRQQLKGDFVYELPFGPDTHLLTSGSWLSHTLSNLSISGSFDFATGMPLTPHYLASVTDVARGSAGSLRPDRVAGQGIQQASGTLRHWFNTAAFTQPANVYGTASRYSIPGPGTVSFDSSFSKTIRFGETRSFEMRATANNVFNTVQYSGVDTSLGSGTYGQVVAAASMRQFTFLARMRY